MHLSVGNLPILLKNKIYADFDCTSAVGELHVHTLIELLDAVRNRILDFALALWKEAPDVGVNVGKRQKTVGTSQVTQIFQTTVYGGPANIVGTANNSEIQFNVIAGDFGSLRKALNDHDVPEQDIDELQAALESDQRPNGNGDFGPKVSGWLSKMIGKAASGTWKVSISVAASVLAEAIKKYYGI